MNEIARILNTMDPEDAATQTAAALKELLPLLGEEGQNQFIMNLLGESRQDKIASMVHL